jgi:hypothetical protein
MVSIVARHRRQAINPQVSGAPRLHLLTLGKAGVSLQSARPS